MGKALTLLHAVVNHPTGVTSPGLAGILVGALATELNYENRYALDQDQRITIDWIVDNLSPIALSPRTELFRAQVGVLTTTSGKQPGMPVISGTEVQTAEQSKSGRAPLGSTRMLPASRFVSEGRANARGIAVLYCASDVETALLESRGQVGSAVTVSKFFNPVQLTLADLRLTTIPTVPIDIPTFKKCLVEAVGFTFSKPVVGDAERYEYTLTQRITDEIKAKGYHGIVFSSSQGAGDNYAFFDTNSLTNMLSEMYQIDSVKINYSLLPSTPTV